MKEQRKCSWQSNHGSHLRPAALSPVFPFAAVVGLDLAKGALLLLAVEPRLKGVLVAAGPGTAKSTLARAYPFILPPDRTANQSRSTGGHRPRPYVKLPLGVTEDRLLGGLDLELTLATGARQLQPGLLAEAHGGILYVDSINLLETGVANHLGCALSDGQLRLEREGLSGVCPADFSLIGTYDPAEGEVQAALRDRVGLIVIEQASPPADARAEVVRRVTDYSRDPLGFSEQYAEATAALQSLITSARNRLPAVRIAVEDRRRLALAALQLGVEGNRADIFALRAARANAALAGRLCVEEEDIAAAIQLVLWPRALVTPAPGAEQEARTQQASERPSPSESSSQAGASEISNFKSEISNRPQLIIQALDTPLPPGLLAPPHRFQRRSVTGSRGETLNRVRGRYVKSIPGRPGDGRVAIDVTLRAAAPLQTLRPHRCAKRRISIEPSDLRFKRFKQKAGMLFIFVVDASGSMALNRMHQAKGALLRLLKEAYLHRDQIALVSFRGRQAEVLLPPSQSVERARRTLESLPVGGGTPLSAGLLAALDLAKRARQVGIQQTMLVLLTDGRANVGVNAEAADPTMRRQAIQQELARVGAALQRAGVASLVIDTQARFTSRDEGRALADLLGGRYIYLPRASAADVYETIASVATDLRGEH